MQKGANFCRLVASFLHGLLLNHHKMKKLEVEKVIKGSGIKGRRRKQRGGNVMFFNDVKQLLNKLELIIGEIIAGNTSIQMKSQYIGHIIENASNQ